MTSLASLLRRNADQHEAGRWEEFATAGEEESATDATEPHPTDHPALLTTRVAIAVLEQWSIEARAGFPQRSLISREEWPDVARSVAADLESGRPATDARAVHEWARTYNWDDGIAPMWPIVDEPATDRGTALLIYWRVEGPYFAAGSPEGPATEARRFRDMLERRIVSGFYRGDRIGYDPVTDNGLTRTQLHQLAKAGIPEILWRGT